MKKKDVTQLISWRFEYLWRHVPFGLNHTYRRGIGLRRFNHTCCLSLVANLWAVLTSTCPFVIYGKGSCQRSLNEPSVGCLQSYAQYWRDRNHSDVRVWRRRSDAIGNSQETDSLLTCGEPRRTSRCECEPNLLLQRHKTFSDRLNANPCA